MPSSSSSPARPRSVTFSEFSELSFIPKDKKVSGRWYSSKDFHRFRKVFVEDGNRLSRESEEAKVLQDYSSYERVGIELFLSKGLAKRVQETKHAHVTAVLSEQELQGQLGICDPERLARASKKSTWTKDQAQVRAAGYWLQHSFARVKCPINVK